MIQKKKGHIPWIFLRHFFQLETSQVEISIAGTLKVNKILKPSVSNRILYIFWNVRLKASLTTFRHNSRVFYQKSCVRALLFSFVSQWQIWKLENAFKILIFLTFWPVFLFLFSHSTITSSVSCWNQKHFILFTIGGEITVNISFIFGLLGTILNHGVI